MSSACRRVARRVPSRRAPREYSVEYRLRTASGGWKWVQSIGKTVAPPEGGPPHRMLGIHLDITERKLSEQKQEMFQFATDQAADAIFWLDRSASFFYVNDQACRVARVLP